MLLVLSSAAAAAEEPHHHDHPDSAAAAARRLDALDAFNHPRQRRSLVLAALRAAADPNTTTTTTTTTTALLSTRSGGGGGLADNDNAGDALDEEEDDDDDDAGCTAGTGIRFECSTAAMDGTASSGSRPHSINDPLLRRVYGAVHSEGLLAFFETAWDRWVALGDAGRDPIGCGTTTVSADDDAVVAADTQGSGAGGAMGGTEGRLTATASRRTENIPPLIPACAPLMRARDCHPDHPPPPPQRPSRHVIGQMSYYCTDACTPVYNVLRTELTRDAALVQAAVTHVRSEQQQQATRRATATATTATTTTTTTAYILPHHPGHHAAYDCFGGYCYLNHAAAIAQALSTPSPNNDNVNCNSNHKVAVLDVDYHCGNGTASIFYANPYVLVVSLHCDPDCDYPFHAGYADDTGAACAVDAATGTGTTLHVPLPPGTAWPAYRAALRRGLDAVRAYDPATAVVSLGLDTHADDPCAIRQAGFGLRGADYARMGRTLATALHAIPTVFVQEGGYRMDTIGAAAVAVVTNFDRRAARLNDAAAAATRPAAAVGA